MCRYCFALTTYYLFSIYLTRWTNLSLSLSIQDLQTFIQMHCLTFRPRTPWWRGLQSNQPHGQQNINNISIPRFEDPGGLFPPLKTRRYRPRHNNNVRWHTAYGIPDPCRVRRCDITRIRVPATMTLRDPRSCQATLTGLSLRFLKLSSTNSTENRNSLIHLKLTWLSY